jgi:transposase
MTRRAAENKSKRAARRAHKRQLANVIIRRMWNDADNLAHANSTPSSAAA